MDKFLHASDAAGGGVGRYIRTLSEESRRRGHTVDEFGCAADTGPANRPAFVDFNESVGWRDRLRILHNPSAAAMLHRHLRSHPVDVAHLHNIYHHVTASILPVLKSHHVGVVMTVHDYRQIGRERLFWRWGMDDPDGGRDDAFLREAKRRCAGLSGWALRLRGWIERAARWYARDVDTFLCPTKFLREELRRAGTPRSKIQYAPIPVEIPDAPPSADDGKTLLFAGRLTVEKSPGLLLDLAKRLPDVNLVLAGDGPLRDSLDQRRRREGLFNVELIGHLTREEITPWFARAAAVVVTSRCMENSPVAMLEAMAAGRCVIAPDQPPLREWIAEGQTGRLYKTGDATDLTRAVKTVLADDNARRTMGAAARQIVQQQHNPSSVMNQIEQAYEGAIRRCALR
ncbi:MAG: glycosyltransferase family 4 protein [Phycisphaerae bacterium]|nr:glycosyltransferase family 4 protein [Phycisphaerae bacterium]